MRLGRDLRLIPLVVLAAGALFVLKTLGILIDGGYTLPRGARAQDTVPAAQSLELTPVPTVPAEEAAPPATVRTRSYVRDMLDDPLFTGSVAAPKPDAAPKPAPATDKTAPANGPAPLDLSRPPLSAGERAVLESLNQRRQELEARGREMDVRESLLKAAEKRIETRLQDLKDQEARLTAATQKRDEADLAKFKSLVSMYETMKAKDAAKIFDRLEMRILVEVANQMNPRRMSDILAQMSPEAAERLTIELANRSGATERTQIPAELPKIEGRPSGT
jgi:flagellar motility protein MotE (MotC chaperone)